MRTHLLGGGYHERAHVLALAVVCSPIGQIGYPFHPLSLCGSVPRYAPWGCSGWQRRISHAPMTESCSGNKRWTRTRPTRDMVAREIPLVKWLGRSASARAAVPTTP